MNQYVQVGSVYRAHGVKGMMKVKVDPFYMEDLLDQEAVFLETSSGPLPYFIQSIEAIAEDMVLL